jgi:hypothetical protein
MRASTLRRLAAAVVPALLTVALLQVPAQASWTTLVSATIRFAAFSNGHNGFMKLELQKEAGTNRGRGRLELWCELDATAGGTRTPCDAIDVGGSGRTPAGVGWSFWNEYEHAWVGVGGTYNPHYINYDPPREGYAVGSPFYCPGPTVDQYKAAAYNFRVAAGNDWSEYNNRSTGTWTGSFC